MLARHARTWSPSPTEVEHVFDVSLAELADRRRSSARSAGSCLDACRVAEPATDGSFPVWFFELPDDTVWGATARMLVELLRLVLDV